MHQHMHYLCAMTPAKHPHSASHEHACMHAISGLSFSGMNSYTTVIIIFGWLLGFLFFWLIASIVIIQSIMVIINDMNDTLKYCNHRVVLWIIIVILNLSCYLTELAGGVSCFEADRVWLLVHQILSGGWKRPSILATPWIPAASHQHRWIYLKHAGSGLSRWPCRSLDVLSQAQAFLADAGG